MLEQAIQRKILDYLSTLPDCWAFKCITSNRSGTPDIIACIGGRFVALEVKTIKGQPSPIQVVQMQRIRDAGGIAEVVRSVEDVLHLVTTQGL